MSFGPSVMKDAGMGGDRPQDLLYSMIYLTCVVTASTALSISMSQKFGRRQSVLIFTIPMGLSLLLLVLALLISLWTSGQSAGKKCS